MILENNGVYSEGYRMYTEKSARKRTMQFQLTSWYSSLHPNLVRNAPTYTYFFNKPELKLNVKLEVPLLLRMLRSLARTENAWKSGTTAGFCVLCGWTCGLAWRLWEDKALNKGPAPSSCLLPPPPDKEAPEPFGTQRLRGVNLLTPQKH